MSDEKTTRMMSADEIRQRFENDVDTFADLATGQEAVPDSLLLIEVIVRAAATLFPGARKLLDLGCGAGNLTLRLLNSLFNPDSPSSAGLPTPRLGTTPSRIHSPQRGCFCLPRMIPTGFLTGVWLYFHRYSRSSRSCRMSSAKWRNGSSGTTILPAYSSAFNVTKRVGGGLLIMRLSLVPERHTKLRDRCHYYVETVSLVQGSPWPWKGRIFRQLQRTFLKKGRQMPTAYGPGVLALFGSSPLTMRANCCNSLESRNPSLLPSNSEKWRRTTGGASV